MQGSHSSEESNPSIFQKTVDVFRENAGNRENIIPSLQKFSHSSLDFIQSKKQANTALSEMANAALSERANTARSQGRDTLESEPSQSIKDIAIGAVQQNRSAFMKNEGLFITQDGLDLILYAPDSHSGIQRTEKNTNTYISFHKSGGENGTWYSLIGAAQGTSENKQLSDEAKK
jgi:hypothetical protein